MLSSQPNDITTHYSFPRNTLIEIGGRHGSLGSKREKGVAKRHKELFIQQGPGMVLPRVTIRSLPDEVLLEIFYAHKKLDSLYPWIFYWPGLVQVCRRWRFVIFASPHHLNLQLFCEPTRPVRKLLDIWPAFPLVVDYSNFMDMPSEGHFDNLIAALERRDRVHEIRLNFLPEFVWKQITTLAQEPFPALATLDISGWDEPVDDIFMNGSAPNLQDLTLCGFSIPRRLGSATHLRSLDLFNIPSSGYMPPETMATSLSALPQLEFLSIDFESPTPHPKRRNRPLPPPTRFVLPALTRFNFKGVSEYLEVLTARINAPLLEDFILIFFHQLVFDIPQIIRFFPQQDTFRSSILALKFDLFSASIYPSTTGPWTQIILCKRLDWQVFSIAQICSQILSLRSSVESLNITFTPHSDYSREDEIDPTLWLQLFHSFTSVQSLEISELLIATALTGQPTADVLPSLRNLSIVSSNMWLADETTQRSIQLFIAARQRSGRPVTVSRRKSI